MRTAAGYRLYDDAAIGRLIAMRQLIVGRGLRPSQAADLLRSPATDVSALVAEARLRTDRPETASDGPAAVDIASFLDAATALDVERMDAILDEWFAGARFEAVMEHAVFPALRGIGEGWTGGRVDPSMEHAASETIRRRVAHFFDAAGSNGGGRSNGLRSIVVGLPPGAHHEIGALAFATAARRGGLHVVYLGANVPLDSWVTAVRTTGASVAVVGAVSASEVAAAARVVAALGQMDDAPIVVVGGSHAAKAAERTAAAVVPGSLDGAVQAVRELAGASVICLRPREDGARHALASSVRW